MVGEVIPHESPGRLCTGLHAQLFSDKTQLRCMRVPVMLEDRTVQGPAAGSARSEVSEAEMSLRVGGCTCGSGRIL